MTGMRIGGLASGMDIDQMVNDLMKAERKRIDVVEQNKQLLEWRQTEYQEINRLFANFIMDAKKSFGLAQTTASGLLYNTGVGSLDWVKTATSSDSNVATVQGLAQAVQGTYQLKVTRLAGNWSAASGEQISVGENRDNIFDQFGLTEGDLVDFTLTTDKGSVNICKADLENVSLTQIVQEINNADIGVKAVYDITLDRMFLQTTQTGSNSTLTITDNSTLAGGGKFITGNENKLKLQYQDADGVVQGVQDSTVYAGVDALFDFGAATGITQSSNNFTINNLQVTLKQTGTTTINVATDVQGIYEHVESFVEQYNSLVDKLNTELNAKRYTDYKPLTSAERESMSEEQIKLWEEKAKSGLLRNDFMVENTAQAMRTGLYEAVEGVEGIYNQLVQIGISTESYASGSRGGKLVINRAKLTEAIEKDADSVLEFLFKTPEQSVSSKPESQMTAEEIKEKRSQSGLITRLFDNAIAGMKKMITKAGPGNDGELLRNVNSTILIDFVTENGSISTLDEDIGSYTKRINTINQYLVKREQMYWNQFTAMEKAINNMNQQSAWLAQQFGGGM